MGEAWFEEHWKPKFDRIRAAIISDKLKKAMYDVIFEDDGMRAVARAV